MSTNNKVETSSLLPNGAHRYIHHQQQRSSISSNDDGDDDDDDDDDNPYQDEDYDTTKLVSLVAVAAAAAASLGYDVGIMAAAIQPLHRELGLTDVQKEVTMGSLNFIAAPGALVGGHVADAYGRKATVIVCSVLFVVGTVIMAAAENFAFLLAGRIVLGLGVGVSFVVAPLYLTEVAPTHLRGSLNTFFDMAINSGILLGYVVGLAVDLVLSPRGFSDDTQWRVMIALGLVLPAIVLIFLTRLPESPRWLVLKEQSEEAVSVLRDLGNGEAQAKETVEGIEKELRRTARKKRRIDAEGRGQRGICGWFRSPKIRLATELGFWQQVTGTEAILYYSADFLAQAGLESMTERLLGNCGVGICKLLPELVAMQFIDRVGRRPLMLASTALLAITMLGLAASFYFNWSPVVVVTLLCAVMTSFSIGVGPFSFLVAAENLSTRERSTGMTLCAASSRVTSGIVAMTAVSLRSVLGDVGFFGLYAALAAVSGLLFYYPSLPEGSQKSLEEMNNDDIDPDDDKMHDEKSTTAKGKALNDYGTNRV